LGPGSAGFGASCHRGFTKRGYLVHDYQLGDASRIRALSALANGRLPTSSTEFQFQVDRTMVPASFPFNPKMIALHALEFLRRTFFDSVTPALGDFDGDGPARRLLAADDHCSKCRR
jgi:hypothetical protein